MDKYDLPEMPAFLDRRKNKPSAQARDATVAANVSPEAKQVVAYPQSGSPADSCLKGDLTCESSFKEYAEPDANFSLKENGGHNRPDHACIRGHACMGEQETDPPPAQRIAHPPGSESDAWQIVSPIPADLAVPDLAHIVFDSQRWSDGKPLSEVYTYRDEAGAALGYVCRIDEPDGRKQFRPVTYWRDQRGNGKWRQKALPTPRPLYGLDRLVASPDAPVVLVEGEKCADALNRIGILAVSACGGANSVGNCDLSPLHNRNVTIWPDADEPGRKYAEEASKALCNLNVRNLRIVAIDYLNVRTGWDVADAIADGWDRERIKAFVQAARPFDAEIAEPATCTEAEAQQRLQDEVTELAALPRLQYELVRKQRAAELDIRVAELDKEVAARRKAETPANGQGRALSFDEPEPWPEPVDGAALIGNLCRAIRRYVVLPDDAVLAVALWVMHTHVFEAFYISPRLAITSPDKRCGKTTLRDVLARLVARPLPADNITPAAVFRSVETARPTLLIDEADTFLARNEELRGVLNSGHVRSGSVIRVVGDENEPCQFSTWSPAAIGKIGKLPDTLEDRSIPVSMRRKLPGENVDKFRFDRTSELDALKRQCARWGQDNFEALRKSDPEVPDALNDRSADNWRALLAIADQAAREWPERARTSALVLAEQIAADTSAQTQLLEDIRQICERRKADRIPSAELCYELARMEDRPWPEWRNGKPITPRQVARLLEPFGIKPSTMRIGRRPAKGYDVMEFSDPFARYLGPGEV